MTSNAYSPPNDSDSLQDLASGIGRIARRGPAPVHLWDPPHCGDIGLAIAADGTWSYQGSPINRISLVQLFASVLRRDDDGQHYLVTPVEKIIVSVADVPFLAVEMRRTGSGSAGSLAFRTNLDDWVEVDAEHPLRFEAAGAEGAFKPYVLVRGNLEARLTRSLVYDLVDQAVVEQNDAAGAMLGVWSSDVFFPIGPAHAGSQGGADV